MRYFTIALVLAAALQAQDDRPLYEVASVKPADPNAAGMMWQTLPDGGFRTTNITLRNLIMNAWDLRDFQISGGPGWVSTAHFNVEAKPDRPSASRDSSRMLQELLKERFQLVVRLETREAPVYALILARKDGRLGPQMTESHCTPYDPAHPSDDPEQRRKACGSMSARRGEMTAQGMDLASIAVNLSSRVDRQVIDRTGLTGKYDLKLTWAADENRVPVSPDLPRTEPSDSGPSIFTALQEQFGLKLEPAKGPVQFLFIEKAEKPSEN
jgi:bla regulator protein blaR1